MEGKIKLGLALLALQIFMLAVTYSFHATLDAQAERDGIATIIKGSK